MSDNQQLEAPPPLMRYPFEDMEVNASFLVACADEDKPVVANRVRAASVRWGQRHKRRFTTRTVEDGIRVWRIE